MSKDLHLKTTKPKTENTYKRDMPYKRDTSKKKDRPSSKVGIYSNYLLN